MTAEVAIANTQGVALAADSAVTIGEQKIYNSACKVFSLSKVEPVGIMIYGAASLMDIPWETLIKIYREELADKAFETIEEYGQDFLKFVRSSRFQSESYNESWIEGQLRLCFRDLVNFLDKALEQKLREAKGGLRDKQILMICTSLIEERFKATMDWPYSDGTSQEFERHVEKRYGDILERVVNEECPLFIPQKKLIELLKQYALSFLARISPDNRIAESGVVIAGYGKNCIFPSINIYAINFCLDNFLHFHNQGEQKICRTENPAVIIPFAQGDIIEGFLKGVSPEMTSFFDEYLNHLFECMPDLVNARLQEDGKSSPMNADFFEEVADKLRNDFSRGLQEWISRYHVEPIMTMVVSLPKNELASMAETLVNLTAFKRKITSALETVGGPIDVAVISRGDGLVWVKRKHYFPGELNQQFFNNYFRLLNNK